MSLLTRVLDSDDSDMTKGQSEKGLVSGVGGNFFNFRIKSARFHLPVLDVFVCGSQSNAVKIPLKALKNDWILAPQRPPGRKKLHDSRTNSMCLSIVAQANKSHKISIR